MNTYPNGHSRLTFSKRDHLENEMYGGERYEYYPLGKYIVAAPGVCGGRPTFKYTRIEVSMVLSLLATGETAQEIVEGYDRRELPIEAVFEAIQFARDAMLASTFELLDMKPPLPEFIAA